MATLISLFKINLQVFSTALHADFVFEVKYCCSYIPNDLLLADPYAIDFQFILSNLTNEGGGIKN